MVSQDIDIIEQDEYQYAFENFEDVFEYVKKPHHGKITPDDIQGLIDRLIELKHRIEKRRKEVKK